VILAEYPKYGGRPGKVGEKPFVAAGLETARLAFEQYKEPLYLVGESLGCGVAPLLPNKLQCPLPHNINYALGHAASVAKSIFPFLPVKLVLTDKYDSIENLKSFRKKISVIGASTMKSCRLNMQSICITLSPKAKAHVDNQRRRHNDCRCMLMLFIQRDDGFCQD